MIIYLSSNNPWQATYTNESGQVLYKCDATSPLTLGNREFTLYRTLAPSTSELGWTDPEPGSSSNTDIVTPIGQSTAVDRTNQFRDDERPTSSEGGNQDDADVYLRDQFKLVGQISYNGWANASSKIKIFNDVSAVNGRSTGSFFKKSGFGLYARNHSFTASDGKEYTWKMGFGGCTLYPASTTTIKNPAPIVTFNRRSLGIFSKSHPPMLEIKEGYEAILDIIMLTFIYVERVRQDGEQIGKGGGGGP